MIRFSYSNKDTKDKEEKGGLSGVRRPLSHASLNTLVWLHFLFGTFAKRIYISARISTNLRDNFTILSAL